MDALGKGSFIELLVYLDNYLQKVERLNKEYEKFNKNLGKNAGKRKPV